MEFELKEILRREIAYAIQSSTKPNVSEIVQSSFIKFKNTLQRNHVESEIDDLTLQLKTSDPKEFVAGLDKFAHSVNRIYDHQIVELLKICLGTLLKYPVLHQHWLFIFKNQRIYQMLISLIDWRHLSDCNSLEFLFCLVSHSKAKKDERIVKRIQSELENNDEFLKKIQIIVHDTNINGDVLNIRLDEVLVSSFVKPRYLNLYSLLLYKSFDRRQSHVDFVERFSKYLDMTLEHNKKLVAYIRTEDLANQSD
jgi:hypothetical protein